MPIASSVSAMAATAPGMPASPKWPMLDQDNAWTRSPLTQGPRGQFPPEPIRYVGSILVRNAIRRKERAEDEDRSPWLIDRMLSKFANAAGKADKA